MKTELLAASVLLLGVAACASDDPYSSMHSDSSANADYLVAKDVVAPMDPSRKVNDQDCTKGIDLAAGNLRCK